MNGYVIETYHRLINELETKSYRYLYDKFSLKDRLTGLIGPRGVGKTTLLLQYIKNHLYSTGEAFYFSADLIYFESKSLLEFVTELYQDGGYRVFFIDEIHKYSNWNQEIKNLYDSFPRMKIVFSGSSMLDLIHGSHDLSRRASLYHLNGLSFREYLNFNRDQLLDQVSWDEMLAGMRGGFSQQIATVEKLAPTFESYLKRGYYPFVIENPASYYDKLLRVVDKTIYEDIANYYKLKTSYLHLFKRILNYLATIPPGKVNVYNLGKHLGVDQKTSAHYLQILSEVGLVRLLYSEEGGAVGLRKPAKVFLHNTTLLSAISEFAEGESVKGTERELFFFQALMDAGIQVSFSKIGDFTAKGAIFEIGGKGKSRKQIKDAEKPAFLVKDDIRVPGMNELPLHYFGFLY